MTCSASLECIYIPDVISLRFIQLCGAVVDSVAASAASQISVVAAAELGAVQPGTLSDIDAQFLCQSKVGNATYTEQLPQLTIIKTASSSKERRASDVTLVTQLSFER